MSQNNKGGLIEGGICQFADHGVRTVKLLQLEQGGLLRVAQIYLK